jgi:uncharacterized cupin superfamily protein
MNGGTIHIDMHADIYIDEISHSKNTGSHVTVMFNGEKVKLRAGDTLAVRLGGIGHLWPKGLEAEFMTAATI